MAAARTPDPRTDAELCAALRGGDATAFDELWRRHRDWVVRMAARITGSDGDALDVLQETFLWLLRKAPELELRARVTTMLFPVVRNLALARRRQRGAAGGDSNGENDGGDRNEPRVEDPPLAPPEELLAALGALPAEQREAVLLRFVDGLSLQEIAAAQRVPLGTVKSRLHHALATLRDDPAARRYFLG